MIGARARTKRERKKENGEAQNGRGIENRGEGRERGPMDRRGTASASPKNASPGSGEVLGPARFSRVRSAFGKATFFFAVFTFRVLSGSYVALIAAPSRFIICPLLFTLILSFRRSHSAASIASVVARFHPPITPTPRHARARARAYTNPLCCS